MKPRCWITFVHAKTSVHRLRELALSVVYASRWYDVVVRTNVDIGRYRLPCQVEPVAWREALRRNWITLKLDTYEDATREGGPVIHIDSDVFLLKPLPDDLVSGDLFAQSPEGLSCYGRMPAMPKEWLNEYIGNLGQFKGYNMGVFGGKVGNVLGYVAHARSAVLAAERLGVQCEQNILEQGVLGGYVAATSAHGLTIQCLIPEATSKLAETVGYVHLMGDKEKPEVKERVQAALARESPEIADRLSCLPRLPQSNRITYKDVVEFWRNKRQIPRRPHIALDHRTTTLTNTPNGLGDTIVLTSVIPASKGAATVWMNNQHWPTLRRHMPLCHDFQHVNWVSLCAAGEQMELGGGHKTQRACRLFALPEPRVPKGYMVRPDVKRSMSKVTIHLDPGPHADSQRRVEHPRARLIGPPELSAIRQFIDDHPDVEFFEIGAKPFLQHDRVQNCTGMSLDKTIMLMSQCGWHMGILSGPTHLAAALDMRIITITTMPKPSELMLPSLIDNGVVECEWLYPQSCVLHQEVDSPHMPLCTPSNLNRAWDGDVWPYWDYENQIP